MDIQIELGHISWILKLKFGHISCILNTSRVIFHGYSNRVGPYFMNIQIEFGHISWIFK